MRDRLEDILKAIQRLSGEVCRSPENDAVQDILFSIHAALVDLHKSVEAATVKGVGD